MKWTRRQATASPPLFDLVGGDDLVDLADDAGGRLLQRAHDVVRAGDPGADRLEIAERRARRLDRGDLRVAQFAEDAQNIVVRRFAGARIGHGHAIQDSQALDGAA